MGSCVCGACVSVGVCMEHYLGGLALSDGRLLHHLCIDRVLELAQPLLALHLGLQRLHFLSKKKQRMPVGTARGMWR